MTSESCDFFFFFFALHIFILVMLPLQSGAWIRWGKSEIGLLLNYHSLCLHHLSFCHFDTYLKKVSYTVWQGGGAQRLLACMIKRITLAWCKSKFASDTWLSWHFELLADGNCLHHISQGFVSRGNFSGGSLQRMAGLCECRISQSCCPTLNLLWERSHLTGSLCTSCCHLPAQLKTSGQKCILINKTDATFLKKKKKKDILHGRCIRSLINSWTGAEL